MSNASLPFGEPGQHPFHLQHPTHPTRISGAAPPPLPFALGTVPSGHSQESGPGGISGISLAPTLPPFPAPGTAHMPFGPVHAHAPIAYDVGQSVPAVHGSPHHLVKPPLLPLESSHHQYHHQPQEPGHPTSAYTAHPPSLSPHAHHSHLAAPLAMPGHEQMHMHPHAGMHNPSPPFRHVFARLAPPGQIALDPAPAQPQAPPSASATASASASVVSATPTPRTAAIKMPPSKKTASPRKKPSSVASSSSPAIDPRAPAKNQANGQSDPDSQAQTQTDDGTADGIVDPKKRASKACETCRVRRTKCVGGRPCDPCKALGVADDCIVRVKARPNRALPRTLMENGITASTFDTSEISRLAGHGKAESVEVPAVAPAPAKAETSARKTVSQSPPGKSAKHNVSATRVDPPRGEAPDAMKRFMPAAGPVAEVPHSSMLHTTFVEDIEASLESWARERGEHLNLSLSAPSPLMLLLENPPPLPLLNATVEEQAIHVFIRALGTYFDFLPPQRLTDLVGRYHKSPNSLSVDQRCLVWSCFCLGIFRERRWPAADTPGTSFRTEGSAHVTPTTSTGATGGPGSGAGGGPAGGSGVGAGAEKSAFEYGPRMGNGSYEEAPYYAAAVRTLDEWGSASSTALIALHVLHMYALTAGGPQDMRGILGRMAWQVRELGFHRDATAKLYPASDSADRLFFMTLYKDSWFATLTGLPPYMSTGTFDTHFTRPSSSAPTLPADAAQEYKRGIDAHPFLVQLTLFENELATLMHVPDAQVSIDTVLDMERKWGDWMVVFRDDQLKGEKPMHHAFSMIRFHWIRLMLRTPFLSSSSLRLSSLSIIARSIAQILNTYATFAHTQVFIASYGELKRIMTCGYLLCVCFWERELDRNETEILMGVCEALVCKLEQGERQGDGGVARGKVQILRRLCALLDLNPQSPASPYLMLPPEPEPMYLIDQNQPRPPDAPINAQEFEAQQTVDALFGYPYSLDWSMPQGADGWLGSGMNGMQMDVPQGMEHVQGGMEHGQMGLEMQQGMEGVMVTHEHGHGPPHGHGYGHGHEHGMEAGYVNGHGHGGEVGPMGGAGMGMSMGMHGMGLQGMYHPS